MENQNNFAAQVAASEKAQQHAQEIQQTRIGGLGGSDASMILKIGECGLAALTATDHKRLAVMLGKTEPDTWTGNVYTNAGHAFEDWAENYLPFTNDKYEREKVLSAPLARNFKIFAHADFVTDEGETVIECKFVQATTEATASKYWAQLQWYYMLGARNVILYHGIGTAEPFEAEETFTRNIERDEETIKMLLAGIQTLDKAISDGWQPEIIDKMLINDTPQSIQEAFAKLADIKKQQKALADEEAKAKEMLLTFMEDFSLSGIVSAQGEEKHQVVYVAAGSTRTFDAAKYAKEHPELDLSPYYKHTTRKASITFK